MSEIIPTLVISEKFYSIQGEGQTMGVPSIFIRLAGCNLLCKSDSWVCDSIEVWQKGTKTDFNKVLTNEDVSRLSAGAHLIFTGGEPLLHQDKIIRFLDWFNSEYNFFPTTEAETNGTIMPSIKMMHYIDYWNCSPKLSNSGESKERRINAEALKRINNRIVYTKQSAIFKFVISDYSDILEIVEDFKDIISMDKVVLMPAGDTQEKLNETRLMVVEQCLTHGFRYSDRLHIVIWNQKTGV